MDRLNFHHLRYFWAVAKAGSIAGACKALHLAQPTVSGQLRVLESALGQRLLERAGRGLRLTEAGRTVFRYADDIFSMGAEMVEALRGRVPEGQVRVRVGIADVLPKLIVHRMLLPVLLLPEPVRLVCVEGKPADLADRLITHDLDVALSDAPLPHAASARMYSHRLGGSPLAVFGVPALARDARRDFPRSLSGAPMLLPTPNTAVRRTLDHWFARRDISPRVVAECEDSALLKVFGRSGLGLFVAPIAMRADVRTQYDARLVGRLAGAAEQFYATSLERRIKHPAVAAITDTARARLAAP